MAQLRPLRLVPARRARWAAFLTGVLLGVVTGAGPAAASGSGPEERVRFLRAPVVVFDSYDNGRETFPMLTAAVRTNVPLDRKGRKSLLGSISVDGVRAAESSGRVGTR